MWNTFLRSVDGRMLGGVLGTSSVLMFLIKTVDCRTVVGLAVSLVQEYLMFNIK